MKIKNFDNFLNEEISPNRLKLLDDEKISSDFDDFLKQITNSLKYDFKMNNLQIKEFFIDYDDVIKKCFNKKFNYKKTLATIKLKLTDENNYMN